LALDEDSSGVEEEAILAKVPALQFGVRESERRETTGYEPFDCREHAE